MSSNYPPGSDAYPPDLHDDDHDPIDDVADETFHDMNRDDDPADELDVAQPGDRYRIRLELLALDGSRVLRGTVARFHSRIDRPGLGPLWSMLETEDDGRLVPVLVDPVTVDKLPGTVTA